jgi:phage tail sheath gpL-like
MIQTGISTSLLRPQTFHVFVETPANGALTSVPLRIALVGAKSAAGTAVAGTVYDVSGMNSSETDALFGVGSELALMIRKSMETSTMRRGGPRVSAVAIAEPGAGTANAQTITSAGAATADGTTTINVAGRRVQAFHRTGDSAATIAAAIGNALKAIDVVLPVTVGVVGAVNTLTHRTKGTNGGDVKIAIESTAPGNTQTVATSAAGAGVTDHQAALDALGALDYDAVVFANHAAADITEIAADIAARWAPAEKKWRLYFLAETGTIGTATALAAAANTKQVYIASAEGFYNTSGEIAAALATGVFSRERPNAVYDNMKLPLTPAPVATIYNGTEVETALAAGLTPLTAVIDSTGTVVASVAKVERVVSTKTTENGNPYRLARDIGVVRLGPYLARQIDIAKEQRLSADANPDGVLQTPETVETVKDIHREVLREAALQRYIAPDKVEDDIAKMVAEIDSMASGRTNVDLYYTAVVGQHQIATKHNIQVP